MRNNIINIFLMGAMFVFVADSNKTPDPPKPPKSTAPDPKTIPNPIKKPVKKPNTSTPV